MSGRGTEKAVNGWVTLAAVFAFAFLLAFAKIAVGSETTSPTDGAMTAEYYRSENGSTFGILLDCPTPERKVSVCRVERSQNGMTEAAVVLSHKEANGILRGFFAKLPLVFIGRSESRALSNAASKIRWSVRWRGRFARGQSDKLEGGSFQQIRLTEALFQLERELRASFFR